MKKSQNNGIQTVKKRITLARAASAEMEERKSIFIGHATPITCEEDARAFIEKKKKEYYDARHNVYAYVLDGGSVARYSDDSEPQGTAGIPILNVIKMSGATDLCIVVTRYFGGILLGAGGLVRAYSAAAKMAIDEAGFAVFENYNLYSMTVSYSDYQRLTVALEKIGVTEDRSEFGEDVTVIAAIEKGRDEELLNMYRELTYGRGEITLLGCEERAAKINP
ncbi:MAG: YigZ family protein [Clostridia bacterium]|nr:YigZ family protein [Clostridia bacterium]